MAKLKPWYDAVELREDLRENRPLDASEFAIHLEHVRDGRAHKDYTDPERFFDRTYVTGSLLDLASQVLRRLSGIQLETSAVFNMATQFGGGKTHALTLLYHLANGGPAAREWTGVRTILDHAGVKDVPEARVAVFVGHGNNGRDGAVAAQWLLEHGTAVDLVLAPRHPSEQTQGQYQGFATIHCRFLALSRPRTHGC